MLAVALDFDLAAACCDLVGRVAAVVAAVVVAGQPVAVDFVPAVCLDLVACVFAVAAVPAAVVVVAGWPVVVDFVPAVALLAAVRGFDPAAYFDLVGRVVLCFGLADCFVLVVAVRTVDPAAFVLCCYLAGLLAARKSERRHQERAATLLR